MNSDVLRFLVSNPLMVVAHHYTFRGYVLEDWSVVRFDSLGSIARYGYLGVDLFFIISGFVIAMSARGRSGTQFLIARARRLYPAFWICMTFTALFTLEFGGGRFHVSLPQYLANLTMFSTKLRYAYVDEVYWSLDVEVRFYLLVALVLYTLGVRRLKPVLFLWLALALVNLFVHVPRGDSLCLSFAGLFVSGVAYASMARAEQSKLDYLTLAIAIPVSVAYGASAAGEHSSHWRSSINPTVVAALTIVFQVPFWLIASRKIVLTARNAWLGIIGGLTYPLYLIHENVGFMILNAFAGADQQICVAGRGTSSTVMEGFAFGHSRLFRAYSLRAPSRARALAATSHAKPPKLTRRLHPARPYQRTDDWHDYFHMRARVMPISKRRPNVTTPRSGAGLTVICASVASLLFVRIAVAHTIGHGSYIGWFVQSPISYLFAVAIDLVLAIGLATAAIAVLRGEALPKRLAFGVRGIAALVVLFAVIREAQTRTHSGEDFVSILVGGAQPLGLQTLCCDSDRRCGRRRSPPAIWAICRRGP